MKRFLYLIVSMVLATLGVAPAFMAQVDGGNISANSKTSVSDVSVFPGGPVVTGASAVLTRSTNAVSLEFDTVGLVPGNVYTIWWVVFNEPQNCATNPCGLPDLNVASVNASLLWATGRIVSDPNGQASLSAHLVPGNPEGEVRFGPGLVNPLKAQIHAVLRDHGAASGDMGIRMQQLTTFGGGCGPAPGFAGCANVQFSLHL